MTGGLTLILLACKMDVCKALLPETWPTWFAGFVGIVAAFLYWRTLRAIQRQTSINEYSERSWILIDLDGHPTFGGVETDEKGTLINFKLTCRNNGRTPAWIDEQIAILREFDTIPSKPDLTGDSVRLVGPEPVAIGGSSKPWDVGRDSDRIKSFDNYLLFYGVVKYHDTFGGIRETFFGYSISIGGGIELLRGYPEYNKHT